MWSDIVWCTAASALPNQRLLTDDVLQGIEDCIDLAPYTTRNNIKGIQAARELFGKELAAGGHVRHHLSSLVA